MEDMYHEDDVAIPFNKHSLPINKNQCSEDVIFKFEDKELERKRLSYPHRKLNSPSQ